MAANGHSISYRAWVIVNAAEFLGLHDVNGLPLADLVGVMYQLAFGRSPNPADVTYWLNQMAGGVSRWDFVYAVLFSAEFTNRL